MNEEKLQELLGKMVNELGAAVVGAHVTIGDQLGLYKALAANGGLTAAELAERTGTAERYVREWLAGQAASGYIDYDAEAGTCQMTMEQAAVLADEESPVYMAGGFYGLESIYANQAKLTDAFRTGEGVGWGEHSRCFYCGTEKFFRPLYRFSRTFRARSQRLVQGLWREGRFFSLNFSCDDCFSCSICPCRVFP